LRRFRSAALQRCVRDVGSRAHLVHEQEAHDRGRANSSSAYATMRPTSAGIGHVFTMYREASEARRTGCRHRTTPFAAVRRGVITKASPRSVGDRPINPNRLKSDSPTGDTSGASAKADGAAGPGLSCACAPLMRSDRRGRQRPPALPVRTFVRAPDRAQLCVRVGVSVKWIIGVWGHRRVFGRSDVTHAGLHLLSGRCAAKTLS
jgi:hypothetical protein